MAECFKRVHLWCIIVLFQDYGVKEDELQSILNYLLTIHEVTKGLPKTGNHRKPYIGL